MVQPLVPRMIDELRKLFIHSCLDSPLPNRSG
jgi:hypothetical protein